MSRPILLIGGLPGSGKTTMAFSLCPRARCYAADDYFERDGTYRFSPQLVPDAHDWCQRQVRDRLRTATMRETVAVHNTFCEWWELEPYVQLANECKRQVIIIRLFDRGLTDEALAASNKHGVPVEVIAKMRARWMDIEALVRAREGSRVINVYRKDGSKPLPSDIEYLRGIGAKPDLLPIPEE